MRPGPRTDRTSPERRVADRLARAGGLFVGTDFDGTLAPIDDDPDAPAITPACRRALSAVSGHPNMAAAVVSGRALSDLRPRVSLPDVVYAGNHGLELGLEAGDVVHPLAERSRPRLRRVLDRLSGRLASIPGCEIEDKRLTVTVHVRRTPPRYVDAVREAVEASVRPGDGLRVRVDRQAFEVRPAIAWDKGTAVRHLAGNLPDEWRTVYVGDGATDEDAFRAVRPEGVGVLVGSRHRTAATCRLPAQSAVAPFLKRLAERVPTAPDRPPATGASASEQARR